MRTNKKSFVTLARVAKEDTPPRISSIVTAVIIATLLGTGFPSMLGTAMQFEVEAVSLFLTSFFASLVFSYVYYLNNKKLSILLLAGTPLLVLLIFLGNVFLIREGSSSLLDAIKNYAIYNLPGTYSRTYKGVAAVTTTLEVIGLIPISITSYLLMKRKFIWIASILYAPYFGLAVANIAYPPASYSVIIAIMGALLLLTSIAASKKQRTKGDKFLLIMTLPVLIATIILGSIFPMNKYDKDTLAVDALNGIKILAIRANESSGGRFNKLINYAIYGRHNAEAEDGSHVILCASLTDLSRTGPWNPPYYRIFNASKAQNFGYTDDDLYYGGNYMYYKLNSMDVYEDNNWIAMSIPMNPYSANNLPEAGQAQYTVTIATLVLNEIDVVPLYSDNLYINGSDITPVNTSLYNSSEAATNTFFCSPVPPRTGNIYSDEYLNEYVYDTCIYVPDSTEEALIRSGVLPDWYMDAYNGTSSMSDADKVRAVTDYVRNLHRYDSNTPYPPEDTDFVVWFITEADSGICVHYASASVILLRMLGIPARYVEGYNNSQSTPNNVATIYSTDAHSWFEFFDPQFGWIMGDSTPGNELAASHFNIDAIAEVYPQTEYDVFSTNPLISQDEDVQVTTTEETASSSEVTTTSEALDATNSSEHFEENEEIAESSVAITTPSSVEVDSSTLQTSTASNEPKKDKKDTSKVNIGEQIKATALKAFHYFAPLLTVIGLVVVTRLGYITSWKIRFSNKDRKERAKEYYRYYKFVYSLISAKLPSAGEEIAAKAAFSNEKISAEDIKFMTSECSQGINKYLSALPAYKKILWRLFLV